MVIVHGPSLEGPGAFSSSAVVEYLEHLSIWLLSVLFFYICFRIANLLASILCKVQCVPHGDLSVAAFKLLEVYCNEFVVLN